MGIKQELADTIIKSMDGRLADMTVDRVRQLAHGAYARISELEVMLSRAQTAGIEAQETALRLLRLFDETQASTARTIGGLRNELTVMNLNAFKRGKADGKQEDRSGDTAPEFGSGSPGNFVAAPKATNNTQACGGGRPVQEPAERQGREAGARGSAESAAGQGADRETVGPVACEPEHGGSAEKTASFKAGVGNWIADQPDTRPHTE